MFSCEAGDGRGAPFGRCLCHTPAFARLNASLSARFSGSALASAGGVFAAGSGSTAVKPAPRRGRIAFANVRIFDGRSDALRSGLRVEVENRRIRAVEPAGSAGRRRSGGRRLRRTGADAGADRRALARDDGAVSAPGPVHGGRRLHQSRRGRRSRTRRFCAASPASATWPARLRAEAGDRRRPRRRGRASGRRAR